MLIVYSYCNMTRVIRKNFGLSGKRDRRHVFPKLPGEEVFRVSTHFDTRKF